MMIDPVAIHIETARTKFPQGLTQMSGTIPAEEHVSLLIERIELGCSGTLLGTKRRRCKHGNRRAFLDISRLWTEDASFQWRVFVSATRNFKFGLLSVL